MLPTEPCADEADDADATGAGDEMAQPPLPDDPHEAILARLAPELRGGDDRELWSLAVRRVASDLLALDRGLVTPPRHLTLALARVPGRSAGIHPDAHATLHLVWERDRGETAWRFAGEHPRQERRRGSYSATACIPRGTTRLAYVDVVLLWRPRLPWADPTDTEIGRQVYRFRRDADARWLFGGTREESGTRPFEDRPGGR